MVNLEKEPASYGEISLDEGSGKDEQNKTPSSGGLRSANSTAQESNKITTTPTATKASSPITPSSFP